MNLSETDKLKYWLDARIAMIRVLLLAVLFQYATNEWLQIMLVVYGLYSLFAAFVRTIIVYASDPAYMRTDK